VWHWSVMSNMQPVWPMTVSREIFRTLSCSWVRMKDKFCSNLVNSASTVEFCKQYWCCNVLHMYCIVTFYSGKFPAFNSGRCEKVCYPTAFPLLHKIYSRNQKRHFGFLNVIYFIVTTNMFQPLMWPSSGW
jgi:hypothetical protein